MWQQYFERAPRQREMSTLSCGVPQGSACYWDLTTQLSNSGVCFLRDNWKVLILLFFRRGEKTACLWRNGTRLNRAISTPALQKGGKVMICCRKWFLFPRDSYFIIFIWLPLHWIYPGFAGKVEYLIDFIIIEQQTCYKTIEKFSSGLSLFETMDQIVILLNIRPYKKYN